MFTVKYKFDGLVEIYKFDGSVEIYKALLVAKRCTQTFGINYQETFALVAKMNSVKVFLLLVANQKWPLL